jgi:uncharacterized cupin superfamily protein
LSVNLLRAELAPGSDRDGYASRELELGPGLGAVGWGGTIYELEPGERVCPYHWHVAEEEWLLVLAGTPLLRTPEGERTLEPGDTVCFPAGPDGAHHVKNAGEGTVRVALLSTKSDVGIAEYPDSDKVGVWAGDAHYMLRRSGQLDYWDGEQ